MADLILIAYEGLGPAVDGALRLADLVSPEADPREADLLAYLREAPPYCAYGAFDRDVLDASRWVPVSPGLSTDGTYIWPNELWYYVERYHVRLPEHFVDHMESRHWVPPLRSEVPWPSVHQFMAGVAERRGSA